MYTKHSRKRNNFGLHKNLFPSAALCYILISILSLFSFLCHSFAFHSLSLSLLVFGTSFFFLCLFHFLHSLSLSLLPSLPSFGSAMGSSLSLSLSLSLLSYLQWALLSFLSLLLYLHGFFLLPLSFVKVYCKRCKTSIGKLEDKDVSSTGTYQMTHYTIIHV